ncbi:uncharacterized protein N7482_003049 [Penicillium canariense]|uniref:Uncharacterized protein n=1 Tax=Penicillium canariense TaxID=189055 RepID=A0A9W9IIP4_9EURO|nr:uncharacterized protein N7482_003049 [Penicillium canariense]KAJ5177172.1 hypothetical protein N7482_003049 [Penicillium canariense]
MIWKTPVPLKFSERRPWLLSMRSSQAFIVVTVSISMFTSTPSTQANFMTGFISIRNGTKAILK